MNGLRTPCAIVVSLCVLAGSSAGCRPQTRQRVLAYFFDGVTDTPRPPTRRTRRDLLREVDALKQQLADTRTQLAAGQLIPPTAGEDSQPPQEPLPLEQARTWDEATALLPSPDGAPDWSQALENGVVAPQPGLTAQTPAQPILPLDVELIPESDPTYAVTFRHATHTGWLSCANCHPGLFQMKKGATTMTMQEITEGRHCGACHGKVAFSTDACARCHRALGE